MRIAHDKFDGPVTVRFDAPGGLNTGGLSVAEISIAADATSGQAEIVVPIEAKPGSYALIVTASAPVGDRTIRATTSVRVTVPALPPPPLRIAVSTSPKVQAYQKGKNTFAVRVARAEFDDPITVTFDNVPDGLKIPAIIVPAGRTEATAELTADAAAKLGSAKVTVTARAAPKGVAMSAATEIVAEVLDPTKAPVDVVFALDCTGSMRKSVDGLTANLPTFGTTLSQAGLNVRFGVVGFRDTTLGQGLEVKRFGDERMTTDVRELAAVIRGLRLGGGGGEGESSLDGIAEAARLSASYKRRARVSCSSPTVRRSASMAISEAWTRR